MSIEGISITGFKIAFLLSIYCDLFRTRFAVDDSQDDLFSESLSQGIPYNIMSNVCPMWGAVSDVRLIQGC